MKNKVIKLFLINFLFFLIISLLFHREYLYTYRIMVLDVVPYEHYQNQLLFYATGLDEFKIVSPPALRIIPTLYFYFIYDFFPCLKLSSIPETLSVEYQCTTNAIAIGNYFLLIITLILVFYYFQTILKKSFTKSFLLAFLFLGLIRFADYFGVDRFVIFYILLILFFYDNIKVSFLMVVFSFLVSEKIVLLFFIYSLLKAYEERKKKYLFIFLSSIISSVLYLFLLFFGKKYFSFFEFEPSISQLSKLFYDRTAIANGLVPLIIFFVPYFFFIRKNKKTFLYILLPLVMSLFSIYGGAAGLGRYLSTTIPFYLIVISKINFKYFENRLIS